MRELKDAHVSYEAREIVIFYRTTDAIAQRALDLSLARSCQTIVFCGTKRMCEQMAGMLNRQFRCAAGIGSVASSGAWHS